MRKGKFWPNIREVLGDGLDVEGKDVKGVKECSWHRNYWDLRNALCMEVLLTFLLLCIFSHRGPLSSGPFCPCSSFSPCFFPSFIPSHSLYLFTLGLFHSFIFFLFLVPHINQCGIETYPSFMHLFNNSRKMNGLHTILCQSW